ncbi:transcriptional regulator [Shewanella avicenniae]|uniref:Transcriptional regulator n=1 Tax=Shewanella avicenniae TaxID=2814294 RepID=A0ABX7QM08_9GAMM|nr:Cro/CI family transcriptional regulator [Shewanella avicenniae]QSX32487.1 transcriptional regulator [Shewanella avicenniae]
MTKTEAVNFFGSQKALAHVLQRSKTTVSGWPDKLPRGVQFEIQVKTDAQLKADLELFNEQAA